MVEGSVVAVGGAIPSMFMGRGASCEFDIVIADEANDRAVSRGIEVAVARVRSDDVACAGAEREVELISGGVDGLKAAREEVVGEASPPSD